MRAIRWILWFPFRLIGLIALLLAVFAAGLDILKSAMAAKVTLTPLGTLWFNTDAESLNASQAGVQRYISPQIWDPGIQWLLERPAFFSLGVVAVVLLLIAWVLRPAAIKRRRFNID